MPPRPGEPWEIFTSGKRNTIRPSRAIQQVIKSKPKDAAAYANLATAYAGQGKLKEEMQNLQKAVALSPDEPVIHFNLAAAYERRKKTDEAIKEYLVVLKNES